MEASNEGTPPPSGNEPAKQLAVAASPWWVLGGIVAIAVSWLIAKWIVEQDKGSILLVDSANFEWFALLFVLALALERLLEPFMGFVKSNDVAQQKTAVVAAKQKAEQTKEKAQTAAQSFAFLQTDTTGVLVAQEQSESEASSAAEALAASKAKLARVQANRAVFAWAAASTIAVVACAYLGAGILFALSGGTFGLVEIPADGLLPGQDSSPFDSTNRALDFLVTGLIVGAGTKPLHDMVSKIQKSKENSDAQTQ